MPSEWCPNGLADSLQHGKFEVVVVKASFDPRAPSAEPTGTSEFVGADRFERDAEVSPVRYESDFVSFKARADVLCVGHAWAPGGKPVTELVVQFGVGSFEKAIRVIGNRVWESRLGGLIVRPGLPRPFVSIPLSYECAYGGRDGGREEGRAYEPNPVGRGFARSGARAIGTALPNLEDPGHPVMKWWHRPIPRTFGPVGRTWLPRRRLAGTYDKRWFKERAPELPEDFDERYYNAAPEDQQIEGYLRGDEIVRTRNLHPDHPELEFRLPGWRARCLIAADGADAFTGEIPLNLDTLWLDMDALRCVLVWRGRAGAEELPQDPILLVVRDELDSNRSPASWNEELRRLRDEESEGWKELEDAEAEIGEQRNGDL